MGSSKDIFDRLTRETMKNGGGGDLGKVIDEYNKKVKEYNDYMDGLLKEIKDISVNLNENNTDLNDGMNKIYEKIEDLDAFYKTEEKITATLLPSVENNVVNSEDFDMYNYKLKKMIPKTLFNPNHDYDNRTQNGFIIDSEDNLWVCGYNNNGEIGLREDLKYMYKFGNISNMYPELRNNVKSINNIASDYDTGLNRFTDNSLFIITKDNDLYICGSNLKHQLGIEDTSNKYEIIKHPQFDKNVEAICSTKYSTILKDKDNNLWVCGSNNDGQCGIGNTSMVKTFTKIESFNGRVNKIYTSCYNGSFLVVDIDKNLWAAGESWGTGHPDSNSRKSLLSWTKIDQVDGIVDEISISFGNSLMKDINNNLWLTGNNISGLLGIGGISEQKNWKKIETVNGIVKKIFIYTPIFSSVIDINDNLWICAGSALSSPHRLEWVKDDHFDGNVDSIYGFDYTAYVLDKNKTLWTKGLNTNYQQGTGTDTEVTTWTKVAVLEGKVKQFYAGYGNAYIIDIDDNIWVTGLNTYGQLGTGDTTTVKTWTKLDDIYDIEPFSEADYTYLNSEIHPDSYNINERGLITYNDESQNIKYSFKNFKLFNDTGMTKEISEVPIPILKLENSIPTKDDQSFVGRVRKDNNFKVVEIGLSYVQYNKDHFEDSEFDYDEKYYKGDVANDKVIHRFYRGILFFKNVLNTNVETSSTEACAYLICPDPEMNVLNGTTVGPYFNIKFKEDDNYIYLFFDKFLPYRLNWVGTGKDLKVFDMYDKDYNANSFINFEVFGFLSDLTQYGEKYDMGTTIAEMNSSESLKDSFYDDVEFKPLLSGFVKYIGIDLPSYGNLNTGLALKEKYYNFQSHGVVETPNDEGFNNTSKRDLIGLYKVIIDGNYLMYQKGTTPDLENTNANYFPSEDSPIVINDALYDDGNIYFATNFGIYKKSKVYDEFFNISDKIFAYDDVSERDKRTCDFLFIKKNTDGNLVTCTRDYKVVGNGSDFSKPIITALTDPIPISADFKPTNKNYIVKYNEVRDFIAILKNKSNDNELKIIDKDNNVFKYNFTGEVADFNNLSIDPILFTDTLGVIILKDSIKTISYSDFQTEYTISTISLNSDKNNMNINGLFTFNDFVYIVFTTKGSTSGYYLFNVNTNEYTDISYLKNNGLITSMEEGNGFYFFSIPTFKKGINVINTIDNKIYTNINFTKLILGTLIAEDISSATITDIIDDPDRSKYNLTGCDKTFVLTDKSNSFVFISGNDYYHFKPYKLGRIKNMSEIKTEINNLLDIEKERRGNSKFIPYKIDVKVNKNNKDKFETKLDSVLSEYGIYTKNEVNEDYEYEYLDSDPFITLYKRKNGSDTYIISGTGLKYASMNSERDFTKLSKTNCIIKKFADKYFGKFDEEYNLNADHYYHSHPIGMSILIDEYNRIYGIGYNRSKILSKSNVEIFETLVEIKVPSSLEDNYNFTFSLDKSYVFIDHTTNMTSNNAYLVLLSSGGDILLKGYFADILYDEFVHCGKIPDGETLDDIYLLNKLMIIKTVNSEMLNKYYTIGKTSGIMFDYRMGLSDHNIEEYSVENFGDEPFKFFTSVNELYYLNKSKNKVFKALDKTEYDYSNFNELTGENIENVVSLDNYSSDDVEIVEEITDLGIKSVMFYGAEDTISMMYYLTSKTVYSFFSDRFAEELGVHSGLIDATNFLKGLENVKLFFGDYTVFLSNDGSLKTIGGHDISYNIIGNLVPGTFDINKSKELVLIKNNGEVCVNYMLQKFFPEDDLNNDDELADFSERGPYKISKSLSSENIERVVYSKGIYDGRTSEITNIVFIRDNSIWYGGRKSDTSEEIEYIKKYDFDSNVKDVFTGIYMNIYVIDENNNCWIIGNFLFNPLSEAIGENKNITEFTKIEKFSNNVKKMISVSGGSGNYILTLDGEVWCGGRVAEGVFTDTNYNIWTKLEPGFKVKDIIAYHDSLTLYIDENDNLYGSGFLFTNDAKIHSDMTPLPILDNFTNLNIKVNSIHIPYGPLMFESSPIFLTTIMYFDKENKFNMYGLNAGNIMGDEEKVVDLSRISDTSYVTTEFLNQNTRNKKFEDVKQTKNFKINLITDNNSVYKTNIKELTPEKVMENIIFKKENPNYTLLFKNNNNDEYVKGYTGGRFGKGIASDKFVKSPKKSKLTNSTNIVDYKMNTFKTVLFNKDGKIYYSSNVPYFNYIQYDTTTTDLNLEIETKINKFNDKLKELKISTNENNDCIEISEFRLLDFEILSDSNITNDNIKKIELGLFLLYILTNNGKLYAYGYDFFGETGNPDLKNTYLNKFTLIGENVVDVFSGRGRTYKVVKLSDNTIKVYAAGTNLYGALGTDISFEENDSWFDLTNENGINLLGDGIKTVYFNRFNTFILTQAGKVYATGLNKFGECGIGDDIDLHSFKLVQNVSNCSEIFFDTADYGKNIVYFCEDKFYVCGKNSNGSLGVENSEGKEYVITPKEIVITEFALGKIKNGNLMINVNISIDSNGDGSVGINDTVTTVIVKKLTNSGVEFFNIGSFSNNKYIFIEQEKNFGPIPKDYLTTYATIDSKNSISLLFRSYNKLSFNNKPFINFKYNGIINNILIKDYIPLNDELKVVKAITYKNRVILFYFRDSTVINENDIIDKVDNNNGFGSGIGGVDYMCYISSLGKGINKIDENYKFAQTNTGFSNNMNNPINSDMKYLSQQRIFEYDSDKECRTVKEIREDKSVIFGISKYRLTDELLKDVDTVLDNDDNLDTMFNVDFTILPYIVRGVESQKYGVNGKNNNYGKYLQLLEE